MIFETSPLIYTLRHAPVAFVLRRVKQLVIADDDNIIQKYNNNKITISDPTLTDFSVSVNI